MKCRAVAAATGLKKAIGTSSAPEVAAVGLRVLCLYQTAAAGLDVINHFDLLPLAQFSFDLVACSAEGEAEEPNSEEEGICPLCFAAGTPVHTNHGDVPIDKIRVGDEVVARDSESGKLEKEPVTALVPLHKGKLLDIRVEGEREPLRPSVGHPFWVRHGDDPIGTWMASGKMAVGDLLETADGNWRRATSITPVEREETVYNFTVAKDHDYFVGETGFLVHNQNCPCSWGKPKTLLDHFLRHGGDFGFGTPEDYANGAAQFLLDSQAGGFPTKIDGGGVIRVYDPATNTFGSYNPDGTTRTFYKPKRGAPYWNDQPGDEPCIP